MRKLVVALVSGAAALTAAHAQTTQAPGGYVGIGAAFADHKYSLGGISNVDHDDYKASVKVFGGVDLDPLWGVEAGYTDFRSSDVSYTIAYSHRKLDSNPFVGVDDDNDTGIYAGLGLQWNINPQWALSGEYERYGKSKDFGAKPDVWTLAARFNF